MSGDLLLIVGLGAILIAVALAAAALLAVSPERQQISRSLATLRAIELRGRPSRPSEVPFEERVVQPTLKRLAFLGRRLTPDGQVERIKRRLDMAGNPIAWDVDRVLAVKVLGLISGALLGVALPLLFGWGVPTALGLTLVLAVIGLFVPDVVLYQLTYDRNEHLRRQLADALDLLSISVEAGLAFDAALAQVARNIGGPLGEEFSRVLQEMQIGMSRSDALRALADRSNVPELRGFVTAMTQADAFGVPIARVLRVQARDMRTKRAQRAEEAAQRIPVKIIFPLIFCILPCLFIVVIGPAAIGILDALGR